MAIHKLARAALEVAPDRSVREAIELMAKHEVGAITVTQQGQPIGIFTERDLLRRVVLERRDPTETRVSEVMSTPVTDIKDVRSIQRLKKCERTHARRPSPPTYSNPHTHTHIYTNLHTNSQSTDCVYTFIFTRPRPR
jgi:hypothetical protein